MEQVTQIRLLAFLAVFAVMALWEAGLPRRRLTVSKKGRWLNNLGIIFLDSLILRLLTPAAAVGVAFAANQANWGLLNYLELPAIAAIIVAVIILDLVVFLQHVMFHAVPLLWRLHMVHHADLDIDLTTGLRFHPIEIIISMLIKMTVVAALGPPVIAVVIFEIILNGTAMFNHGNLGLSVAVDRYLRLLVVTPDMH
ncbi:MAG: sterol desaturase family protein, partial [Desulfobia sp.]